MNEPVGLLKRGVVKGYNPVTGNIQVNLNIISSASKPVSVDIPAPHSLFYNNGLFIGTQPEIGTPVVVAQGSEGWYFVSFLAENTSYVPSLESGKLLLRTNDNTKITLDKTNNILLGSDNARIHLNTNDKIYSSNFQEEFHFTQASRHVNGLVKRDLRVNDRISQSLKLEYELYNPYYYTIAMDPTATVNIASGPKKNPPFVENREIIYEFQHYSNVSDDLTESNLYSSNNKDTLVQDFNFINRRDSRADTLSLTLAAPNYLMEIVKGTVIDIFGNILDLNRIPLPIGKDQNTINTTKSADKTKSFLSIKELERKSIAYHFEINARKDLSGKKSESILDVLDINSNTDYARNRSRFFIDIDKEGQFKINVPASSEKGNIPLLTRYENYSTYAADNPNALTPIDDNLDIFLDSFAAPKVNRNSNDQLPIDKSNRGSIILMNGDAVATPKDRITEQSIKHGTAYHDILNTCNVHSEIGYINYQNDSGKYRCIDIDQITTDNNNISGPDLNHVVTDTIPISGDNAKAGGRSGSINLDGSLEFNIGANTIDRQSLWLDTAGGIVSNIGRDLKNRSLVCKLDGDMYVQIGGVGVATDSRFNKSINAYQAGVLDIRVMNAGYEAAMIRIDKYGVQVLSPGAIKMHSSQGIKITSDTDISIEAETLTLQGRFVQKGTGGSI